METNFLSHAIVTKVFLPILKRQKTLVDIVFMGSESSISGGRGSIYSASKFAVHGFAQSLRRMCEIFREGINIESRSSTNPLFDDLNFEPDLHLVMQLSRKILQKFC